MKKNGNSLLSFSQERLWFLEQFDPGSPLYNIHRAIRLQGSLKIDVLARSLTVITGRHSVLRCTFSNADGFAVLGLLPLQPVELPVIDLTDLGKNERWEVAWKLAVDESQCSFNLASGPLFRGKILKLNSRDHVLLLSAHRIVADEWSMEVLLSELATIYQATLDQTTDPLPELAVQFSDFRIWQNQCVKNGMFADQLSHWKQVLAGRLPVLELPIDRPRPPVQALHGATQRFSLPVDLTQGLQALSQSHGVTLYEVLLAAYLILLWRYTRQEDLLVGTPVPNRNRPDFRTLVGPLTNMLALRTRISESLNFRQLMNRVRETTLDAFSKSDFPFERLLEELNLERSLSHNPLFQVTFESKSVPMRTLGFAGLSLTSWEVDNGTAEYDLSLSVEEGEKQLLGRFTYDRDLFEDSTIKRLIGHWETLLSAAVQDPEQPISRLPLLTLAERRQILVEWNRTSSDYPTDQCLHQLFEAQVQRSPHRVAVVFEGHRLNYRELNAQANQLAHYLRRHGVGPEVKVAISLDRSLEMVIAVLAVLKAGGAYVPLDPTYPQERLAFMLRDSQARILLTRRSSLFDLLSSENHLVCLDTEHEAITAECTENPTCWTSPDNLAYILYTSGSTGKPKGVMITHRNQVNIYHAWEEAYQLRTAVSSHLQMASYSFDVFSGDLARALCSGGKLVLCPQKALLDGSLLYRLMRDEKVDFGEFVPAVLRNLVQYLEKTGQSLSFMRVVVAGSDSWYASDLEKLKKFCGRDARIINSYGVTEAAIDSLYYEVPRNAQIPREGLVPIGRPFANTLVYVLDPCFQPVPAGVVGELYLGGAGVGRGYLNRPELTSERFIANPFEDSPGQRLYRTGDLARYLADGNIQFLGRLDHQLKVGGYRIEAGEIETVLNQHPQVRESVVVALEDTPGLKRLVAYIVPVSEQAVNISELRSYLRDRLPAYMVPHTFVLLEQMPRTPNGKTDRQALPSPTVGRTEKEKALIAPRNTLELQLAKLWERILGIQPIGVTENFFDLGGHSLLAVRLFAQIEKMFGRDLPLATLYTAPTVEQLAEVLSQEGLSVPWTLMVPIQGEGNRPPFFLQHGTEALTQGVEKDQPFYLLRPHGIDGRRAPRSIEEMAADYIREIRTLQPEGPYYLGGYSLGGLVAFETAQQLRRQRHEVALLLLLDPIPPFEWEQKIEDAITGQLSGLRRSLERINNPWQKIARLGIKQTLRFIGDGLRWRMKGRWKRVERVVKRIACFLLLGLGRQVPPSLRMFYFLEAGAAAASKYVARVYEGRILLLQATEGNGTLAELWRGFAGGGLEVHDLPGAHLDIIRGPEAQLWAKELANCLRNAQCQRPQEEEAVPTAAVSPRSLL